jgi:hypothetical protein
MAGDAGHFERGCACNPGIGERVERFLIAVFKRMAEDRTLNLAFEARSTKHANPPATRSRGLFALPVSFS